MCILHIHNSTVKTNIIVIIRSHFGSSSFGSPLKLAQVMTRERRQHRQFQHQLQQMATRMDQMEQRINGLAYEVHVQQNMAEVLWSRVRTITSFLAQTWRYITGWDPAVVEEVNWPGSKGLILILILILEAPLFVYKTTNININVNINSNINIGGSFQWSPGSGLGKSFSRGGTLRTGVFVMVQK